MRADALRAMRQCGTIDLHFKESVTSRKKIISAAIVSGLAVSGAEAASEAGATSDREEFVQNGSERYDATEPMDVLSVEWDIASAVRQTPTLFEGDAGGGDLIAGRVGDVDILHGIDPVDGADLIGQSGHDGPDLIEATDADPDTDGGDLYLAQTVYGGTGNDGLVGSGLRDGKTLRNGTKLRAPTKPVIGSGNKPRTTLGGITVTKPRVGTDLMRTDKPGTKIKKP